MTRRKIELEGKVGDVLLFASPNGGVSVYVRPRGRTVWPCSYKTKMRDCAEETVRDVANLVMAALDGEEWDAGDDSLFEFHQVVGWLQQLWG